MIRPLIVVALSLLSFACGGRQGGGTPNPCVPACTGSDQCVNGVCVSTTDASRDVPVTPMDARLDTFTPVNDTGVRSDTGGGGCGAGCAADRQCCGGSCVPRAVTPNTNGRTDPSFQNCNGCGLTCDANKASACSVPAGATAPRCVCGSQSGPCADGYVCSSTGSSFSCVPGSSGPPMCGGSRCAIGETCVGTTCQCGSGAACTSGQICCGGQCVDTQTNNQHCGMCNNECGADGPDCRAGRCSCGTRGSVCPPTMGGGFPLPIPLPIPIPGLGSEPGLCCAGSCATQDEDNCGGCGVSCGAGEECGQGLTLPMSPISIPRCCVPEGTGICDAFGPIDPGGLLDGGFPIPGL